MNRRSFLKSMGAGTIAATVPLALAGAAPGGVAGGQLNNGRPFFAYYPMILSHSPFLPTPDSKSRKGGNRLDNFKDMVEYMDKCVGRIVDTLEEQGLREKTVVLFTSDNGTHQSLSYEYRKEERRGEKALPTDGGTHAPLIVNCPGTVQQGGVTDDLVDFSDFVPTLAEIGGARLPGVTLDGRSFWPQCRGERGNPREWIFQYYYPFVASHIVPYADGKLYVIWAQDQRYKLYSHGRLIAVEDRYEKKIIALGKGAPAAEAARRKLQAALDSMPKKRVID